MPLQYKLTDGKTTTVYTGFRGASEKHIFLPGEALVAVWFEGDPELYVTDGTEEAIAQLRKFYMDDFSADNLTITAFAPPISLIIKSI